MALVVTARSLSEASPGFVRPTASSRTRVWLAGRWLLVAGVACYALGLAVEPVTLFAADTPWGDAANAALTLGIAGVTLGACVAAWLTRRDDAGLLLAATLAPVLIAIRALSAALLITFGLSTLTEVVSLGLGLLVLASLTWASTLSIVGVYPGTRVRNAQLSLFQRVGEVTALVVFALALSGAAVRAVGASWACGGMFPDCSGLGLLPFGHDSLADIQLYHRLLGYVTLGLVGWLAIEAFRSHRGVAGLGAASLLLVGATVLDAAVGAVVVLFGVPVLAEVAHTAASAATWSAMVGVIALAHRAPARTLSAAVVGSPPIGSERLLERGSTGAPSLLFAYVQLTKPRVMSLLLATTATAMLIAARGFPDLTIFVATLIGGALMSGGAGAINHYVDRDIDPLMGRTAWRPIPSGMISPRAALQFGIALALIAGAVFVVFVNVLAAVLAFIGLLGYVFIYTLWLKRSTPSNIVIGGAAGAIPPLVGWAAVTNEISSLTAWYLFAIIFFWTPPHFWALSLLIRKHYERAGVPMLPVVRGDDETRRQIVLYSILLVVLTLVLSPFGMMGKLYFVAATLLGGLFVRDALRLWRVGTPAAARRLYLYSILYLFALFTAMAVDRVFSTS